MEKDRYSQSRLFPWAVNLKSIESRRNRAGRVGCVEPQGWVPVLSAVIGSLLKSFHLHEIELRTPALEKHFTNRFAAECFQVLSYSKMLTIHGHDSEEQICSSKRDRHKCWVFFNYIGS